MAENGTIEKKEETTITQVRDFFGMESRDMLDQWRKLTDTERAFFKIKLGELLINEALDSQKG